MKPKIKAILCGIGRHLYEIIGFAIAVILCVVADIVLYLQIVNDSGVGITVDVLLFTVITIIGIYLFISFIHCIIGLISYYYISKD